LEAISSNKAFTVSVDFPTRAPFVAASTVLTHLWNVWTKINQEYRDGGTIAEGLRTSPKPYIRIPISLSKGGYVGLQLGGFSRWEAFPEEGFGEGFPCGKRIGLLILQPITRLIVQ